MIETAHGQKNTLEEELLKKIEISKISRQLKTKLRAIRGNSFDNHSTESYKGYPSSERRSLKRYASDHSDFSPFESVARKKRAYNYLSPLRGRKMAEAPATPKSKIMRTTRNVSGDTEGANLLMYLATSPSPFRSNAGISQFMSSPVKASKSYHEFMGSDFPSTPNVAHRTFSLPYGFDTTPNKYNGVTTPKMHQGAFSNSAGSTILGTPKFNMSDYVNFMSPSPSTKKSGYLKTPDKRANRADAVKNLESITSSNQSLIKATKGEDTEDEGEDGPRKGFFDCGVPIVRHVDGQETEDEEE